MEVGLKRALKAGGIANHGDDLSSHRLRALIAPTIMDRR